MPIKCMFPIRPLTQAAFHSVDHLAMGHAFAIQNEMGRFLDERIYQDELAYRCMESGIEILREPMIQVMHQDFSKSYFLDILANTGAIFELKAVKTLNGNHDVQLINYLLLTGLKYGKLINMRPSSVESRYVSTQLTNEARYNYSLDIAGWNERDRNACRLHDILVGLLNDWGAFLDMNLYREAMIHFLGGDEQVIRPVDIQVGERMVGKQKMALLGDSSAFHVSAIRAHHGSYQKNMTRLLEHSNLQQIHWINFQGATIQLRTLEKMRQNHYLGRI